MADVDRLVQQIKKLKFPRMHRPGGPGSKVEWILDRPFHRIGITVSNSGVSVALEGGAKTFRGKGNTISGAIAAAVRELDKFIKSKGL